MDTKLFHISDLHIGRQLHQYNLRESQEEILHQIVEKTKMYHPNALLIAGDIFDKAAPSGEAFDVFDNFLRELAEIEPVVPVCIIAGNHDSAKRLNYASSFMKEHRIYISTMPPQSSGEYLQKITLSDAMGPVNIYLLPFTKPAYVRQLFPETEIKDYDTAVRLLIEREEIDTSERNVLVAHQFFVSKDEEPERCDSEQSYISVGGIDSVFTDCVREFDYVALGHLHGAQSVGEKKIRYSGSPLKYSVSEEKHNKGITLVKFRGKNDKLLIQHIPLEQPREVRTVKGTLREVIDAATEEGRRDYVKIILTDEESLFHPQEKLEEYYDNILELRIENSKTGNFASAIEDTAEQLNPLTAFEEFYREMNGQPMNQKEGEIMRQIVSDVENDYVE